MESEHFGSDWSLLVFTGSMVWISWSASVPILSAEDGPFSAFSMLACESGHSEAETWKKMAFPSTLQKLVTG